ncbi:MAG TPA: hypothetical protein VE343_16695 [Streptosporangiaceae bacterium]|nr:hypothetical protein [Streptosporangiaceae bacterium]
MISAYRGSGPTCETTCQSRSVSTTSCRYLMAGMRCSVAGSFLSFRSTM